MGQSEVWFKQDDEFDQPYVWANVNIVTNDEMFPLNSKMQVFKMFWIKLLNEFSRELKYNADMAEIIF